MDFESLSERVRGFVQAAQGLALRSNHQRLAPEHLLKTLLDDKEGLVAGLIRAAGGDPARALKAVEAELAKVPRVEGAEVGSLLVARIRFAAQRGRHDVAKDDRLATTIDERVVRGDDHRVAPVVPVNVHPDRRLSLLDTSATQPEPLQRGSKTLRIDPVLMKADGGNLQDRARIRVIGSRREHAFVTLVKGTPVQRQQVERHASIDRAPPLRLIRPIQLPRLAVPTKHLPLDRSPGEGAVAGMPLGDSGHLNQPGSILLRGDRPRRRVLWHRDLPHKMTGRERAFKMRGQE